jgi:hypothetical protein
VSQSPHEALAWRLENPRTYRLLCADALQAAAVIRQAPADLTPTRYLHSSGATIERTRTDPDAWAVRRGCERMSVWGQWSIEPSPSERGADYLAEHSFASPQAALEVLQHQQPPQGEEVQS